MRATLLFGSFACAAVTLLGAEDPSWKNKPIPEWDEQDAKQLLADSPWVGNVRLEKVRDLSEFERRDGGDWEAGIGPRIGWEEEIFGLFGPTSLSEAIRRAHARLDLRTAAVRWESAAPVRAAETKAGEASVPVWQGDYYAIAVYDVRLSNRWNLSRELKGIAFLKRDKKKDLKPVDVEIVRHEDGLATVVYLFSRHNPITEEDRGVRFVAQIGRLFVSQFFFPGEMEFAGKPEF
jgi:hypothetical protein